jgi:hypothetical protein
VIDLVSPPGVTVRRVTDELAQWMSASDGKLDLTTEEIRAAGAGLLALRKEVALTRAKISALTAACERVCKETDCCPICDHHPSRGHRRGCLLEVAGVDGRDA